MAEFDLGLMSDEFRFPFVLQYEQYKLTASITTAYADAGDFDVRFAPRSPTSRPRRPCRRHRGRRTAREADGRIYVIGCDGGRTSYASSPTSSSRASPIRKNSSRSATPFDFATVNPNLATRNFFADPDEWCNMFKVNGERPPGLWRVIVPIPSERERGGRARAETAGRLRRGCRSFFPRPARTLSNTSTSTA